MSYQIVEKVVFVEFTNGSLMMLSCDWSNNASKPHLPNLPAFKIYNVLYFPNVTACQKYISGFATNEPGMFCKAGSAHKEMTLNEYSQYLQKLFNKRCNWHELYKAFPTIIFRYTNPADNNSVNQMTNNSVNQMTMPELAHNEEFVSQILQKTYNWIQSNLAMKDLYDNYIFNAAFIMRSALRKQKPKSKA